MERISATQVTDVTIVEPVKAGDSPASRLVVGTPMLRHASRTALFLIVTLSMVLVAVPAQAQRIKPDFFGMHASDWATSAPAVPVGSANFTNVGTYWHQTQTSSGAPDFTRLDAQVRAAAARGARPMVILGGTPDWAISQKHARAGYAARTQVPRTEPWRAYVRTVAARYGTRVDYQIWPEPNIVGNWAGTPKQMAKLTQVASKAIHAKARRARVVAPALVLRLSSQRTWFKRFYASRVGGKKISHWIDVVAINGFPKAKGGPEASDKLLRWGRAHLRKKGIRKPVWNNEINYGVAAGGSSAATLRLSANTQAAWVSRTYLLNAWRGIGRVYWMGWYQYPTLAISMVDAEGRPTAAATAHKVTRSWLVGANFRGCKVRKRLYTCTIKGKSEVRRVYWRTKGRQKVRTHKSTTYRETALGKRTKRKGAHKFRVTTLPVMVRSKR